MCHPALRERAGFLVLLGADDPVADPHLPGHVEQRDDAEGDEDLAEHSDERCAATRHAAWPPSSSRFPP
jgi:hypothetical protein